MSRRILLVEDDRTLRATLSDALQTEGYEVLGANSVADAWARFETTRRADAAVDLLLLDLGLPDREGIELLAQVRAASSVPVIVISARHGEPEKVRLLDAGADDFLVKPFGIGELLARIRVALRNKGHAVAAAITRYAHGELSIDLATRRVVRGGVDVHLTPTEFNLLARLVRSAGQVITHRQLLADVWGASFVEHTHYLRLYIGQLRAKLESDSSDPVHLLTEPGVGYRLAAAPD